MAIPSGVSVDLANALGESLHRKVVIRNIRFDGLIPELKTGGVDLIISSMTATPKRAEEIDFSDPYLRTGLCLLVGAKSGIPVNRATRTRPRQDDRREKRERPGSFYAGRAHQERAGGRRSMTNRRACWRSSRERPTHSSTRPDVHLPELAATTRRPPARS